MAYQSSAKAQYLDGFRQLEKKEKKIKKEKKAQNESTHYRVHEIADKTLPKTQPIE